MKTILDITASTGAESEPEIRVIVTEHPDHLREYSITIERAGMSASVCSVRELRFVSLALDVAARRIEKKEFPLA